MVKPSSAAKTGPRTDPEAIERRRMQNRLAQRKRRLKRAQMAREEKERQQRLQAAQVASQLTFMNAAYLPLGQQSSLYQEQKFHPSLNNYYSSTPPQFEDIFTSSPYIASSALPPFEHDSSFFVNEYPSPSLSGYAPSTPPRSIYTPSLVDEDLSNGYSSASSSVSNMDLDPSIFLGSTAGPTSSPVPSAAKAHALDAFGLVPLHTLQSPPRLQHDRHRSSSLPTPFTPPRSVPSLSSPPPTHTISRSQTFSTPDMVYIKENLDKSIDNNHDNNFDPNLNVNLDLNTNLNPSHASAHTHGKTGLHVCAEQGNSHVVQLLLGYGADVDSLDEYGCTPLHYAVRNNHVDVVKQLIERGAATSVADVNGITPMHVAAESGSEEMIQTMMNMMASPGTSNAVGTNTCSNTMTATMTNLMPLPALAIPAQDTNFLAGLIPTI